jgi:hypothetical protein
MYSSRSITKLICLVLWYESTTTTDTMLMELALAQWLIMTSTMSIRISIITTLCSTMSGGAASMAAGSPERGCRRQPTGVETACGCGAAKLRSNRLSAAGGCGQSAGAGGSGGCHRRAGGAAGCESIRGSAEVGQQVCGLRSVSGGRPQSCPTGAN